MARHHKHKSPQRPAAKGKRPGGALARSLAQLTVAHVQQQQAREQQLAYTKLGEMIQQLQESVSGAVTDAIESTLHPITWPYPFVYAPGQRDSSLEKPQFSFGVEILSGYGVIILPTITGWTISQEGFYTGATMGIQAWFPQARKKQQFQALIHATFTGYGAPQMEDNDGDPATLPTGEDDTDL